MLKQKLLHIESKLNIKPELVSAVKSVRLLLNEIDFANELIPLDNLPKFTNLLIFIKGSSLTTYEENIIEELFIKRKI